MTMSSHTNNTITDIASLIPQRPPIMMVDEYGFEDDENCWSLLNINSDNIFLDTNGNIIVEGLLEHIAQTAAAHIGFKHRLKGEDVGLGYIGDIKRCAVSGPMPSTGQSVKTHLKVMSQINNITMISAETKCNETAILSCRMKLTD